MGSTSTTENSDIQSQICISYLQFYLELHKRLLLDEILDSDAQRRRGSTFLPGVSSNALSLLSSPKPFDRPAA